MRKFVILICAALAVCTLAGILAGCTQNAANTIDVSSAAEYDEAEFIAGLREVKDIALAADGESGYVIVLETDNVGLASDAVFLRETLRQMTGAEETYEVLRLNLAGVLGEQDDYLDVFVSDMKYSDQPITRYISEDLADIYQDVKDFIFVFQLGLNATMHDALALCEENFALYWGQKLVNTMRALHDVKYAQPRQEEETGSYDESEAEE